MMELNVQDWQEFLVGRLFDSIYKAKAHTKEEINEIEKGLNFVSRIDNNNGIDTHVAYEEYEGIEKGNCITIGDTTATCFYQDKAFIAGDHMVVLRSKWMNRENGLFFRTLFTQEYYRYCYGRAYKMDLIKKTKFKLPIQHNENGSPIIDTKKIYSDDGYIPDWQFMEDYIKSLRYEPITTRVEKKTVVDLDVEHWEEFSVGKIFTLLNGKGITKEEIECNLGDLPAIQSAEENNGVLGKISEAYCKKMKYTMTRKACLTVARTGSAGFVSYQGEGCVVGDSAKILLLEDDVANVYVYMFLQTMLTASRFKYDYGRKVTESKYLDDILKLPVQNDEYGNPIIDEEKKYSEKGYIPDWKFMEKYIKDLPYSDKI